MHFQKSLLMLLNQNCIKYGLHIYRQSLLEDNHSVASDCWFLKSYRNCSMKLGLQLAIIIIYLFSIYWFLHRNECM